MYPALSNDTEVDAPFLLASKHSEEMLRYFGFREAPFGVTPNPEFLFFSASHRDALQAMIHSIESNLGFTVLLGEPGTGKTSLLFQLLKQYQECARTAFVFQTQCKRNDLLRYIASELELPWQRRDEVELHQRLNKILLEEARAGRRVLIFVDEAQNLQTSSLEAIRLLSDFESPVAKLLHVVLAGSARLGESLRSPELSQLAQRIFTVCRLGALTAEEAKEYVIYRLGVAGAEGAEDIFSPESLAAIAERTDGVPRLINSVCLRSLSLAYTTGDRRVTREIVERAAQELDLAKSTGMSFRVSRTTAREKADVRDRLAEALSELRRADPPVLEPEQKEPEQPLRSQECPEDAKVIAPAPDTFGEAHQFAAGCSEADQQLSSPKSHSAAATVQPWQRKRRTQTGWLQRAEARLIRFAEDAVTKTSEMSSGRPLLVLIAALMLVAFGLPVGWRVLNGRLRTSEQPSKARETGVISAEPKHSDARLIAPSQLNVPTSTVTANAQAGDHRVSGAARTQAATPVIRTVPDSLVPSKIGQQSSNRTDPQDVQGRNVNIARSDLFGEAVNRVSSKTEAANTLTNFAGVYKNSSQVRVPLASVPALPPRLDERAEPTMEAPAEPASTPLKATHMVQPEYPKMARLSHIEGDVLVELEVDSNGRVQKVRTVRGDPMLKDAAEEAVRKWRFAPPPDNQTGEPSVTQIRFNFRLSSGSEK